MSKLIVAYNEDCPHYQKAAAGARVAATKFATEVEVTEREDLDEDLRGKFLGSPTLFLDGEPLFEEPKGAADSCRQFTDEHGRKVNFPNAGMIEQQLEEKIARKEASPEDEPTVEPEAGAEG